MASLKLNSQFFFRRTSMRALRIRSPPREPGLEMSRPRRRRPNHPMVGLVRAALSREMAEGPSGTRQDLRGQDMQGHQRLVYFRLRMRNTLIRWSMLQGYYTQLFTIFMSFLKHIPYYWPVFAPSEITRPQNLIWKKN